ncbi:MAG: hypothetical protein OHK0013_37340 [Sandaracinaceae bacterium]
MRGLGELTKTTGVLLAMWLALGLVGWLAGAFPDAAPTPLDGGAERDAEVASSDDAASLDAGPEPDAWVAPAEPPPPPPGPTTTILCAAPDDVRWARGDLAGDERAESIVGCADGPQLFGFVGDGALVRIARFTPIRPTPLGDAAFADVDGDGRRDLLLAMGEGLFWIPRDASGGLAEPQVLAPARHGALATASMDASPGEEIVVVHGEAPRPELWLFRGGSAPVHTATVPAPLDTVALAILDLDVDGHLDIVAVGAQQVLLAFGDSRGGFTRTRSLTPGGRGVFVREGQRPEVLIEREDGACTLTPAPELADGGACVPLDGVGGEVRGLATTGDGRLVGWRHPNLVVWSEARWELAATLATTRFGVHRFALETRADATSVWLLGSAARDEARALELVSIPFATTSTTSEPFVLRDGAAQGVADGPMPLAVALPDPNTPR